MSHSERQERKCTRNNRIAKTVRRTPAISNGSVALCYQAATLRLEVYVAAADRMSVFAKSVPDARPVDPSATSRAGHLLLPHRLSSYAPATRHFRASSLRTGLCTRHERRRGGVLLTRSGRHPSRVDTTRNPVRDAATLGNPTKRIAAPTSGFDSAGGGPARPTVRPHQATGRPMTLPSPAARPPLGRQVKIRRILVRLHDFSTSSEQTGYAAITS